MLYAGIFSPQVLLNRGKEYKLYIHPAGKLKQYIKLRGKEHLVDFTLVKKKIVSQIFFKRHPFPAEHLTAAILARNLTF